MSTKQRLRAALAEAGYPNALVHGSEDDPMIRLSGERGVPEAVCWRAHALVHPESTICWSCWSTGEPDPCTHPVVVSDAPLPAGVAPEQGEERRSGSAAARSEGAQP